MPYGFARPFLILARWAAPMLPCRRAAVLPSALSTLPSPLPTATTEHKYPYPAAFYKNFFRGLSQGVAGQWLGAEIRSRFRGRRLTTDGVPRSSTKRAEDDRRLVYAFLERAPLLSQYAGRERCRAPRCAVAWVAAKYIGSSCRQYAGI